MYDKMMRNLRDKGWIDTENIIRNGITSGHVLEIGPGPGYLGLEWLLKTEKSYLTALEISPNIIKMAEKNASEYGLSNRVSYIEGNAQEMPFDGVFSNGSLHEWEHPERIFNEIDRVLKPKGLYRISDLKRDISFVVKWFMKFATNPKEIRPGLISSINAAYIVDEINTLLERTKLREGVVRANPIGLEICGMKQG